MVKGQNNIKREMSESIAPPVTFLTWLPIRTPVSFCSFVFKDFFDVDHF